MESAGVLFRSVESTTVTGPVVSSTGRANREPVTTISSRGFDASCGRSCARDTEGVSAMTHAARTAMYVHRANAEVLTNRRADLLRRGGGLFDHVSGRPGDRQA